MCLRASRSAMFKEEVAFAKGGEDFLEGRVVVWRVACVEDVFLDEVASKVCVFRHELVVHCLCTVEKY